MYWGQIAFSFLAGATLGYHLYESGHTLLTAVLAGVLLYIGSRWVIAWLYRIRFWQGTRSTRREYCPNCNRHRSRLGGDWLIECHACGWKEGWPGVRWVTRSVPSIQLRRTVYGPSLLIFAFAMFLVMSGASAQITQEDISESVSTAIGRDATPEGSASTTSSTDPNRDRAHTAKSQSESTEVTFNESRVEDLIIEYVNDRRSTRGYTGLTLNERAAAAADAHAEDMATNDYFSHTSQDGETQLQRYSFCQGGENAAKSWVNRRIRMDDGSIVVHRNERELAQGIVNQWMNSTPHRERGIYGDRWRSAGAGIAITGDGEVYAVAGFCQN